MNVRRLVTVVLEVTADVLDDIPPARLLSKFLRPMIPDIAEDIAARLSSRMAEDLPELLTVYPPRSASIVTEELERAGVLVGPTTEREPT